MCKYSVKKLFINVDELLLFCNSFRNRFSHFWGSMFIYRSLFMFDFKDLYILVMQRFGNLQVGSVFGLLHPETAVSVSSFQKRYIYSSIYFFF